MQPPHTPSIPSMLFSFAACMREMFSSASIICDVPSGWRNVILGIGFLFGGEACGNFFPCGEECVDVGFGCRVAGRDAERAALVVDTHGFEHVAFLHGSG